MVGEFLKDEYYLMYNHRNKLLFASSKKDIK